MGLSYHNGFLQITTDALTNTEIEKPFWALLDSPKWKSVDIDMKEALDLRDNKGRDPAWYAARALETALKIMSGDIGCTTGKERSAFNFIDNILSARSGRFISTWEGDILKAFFTHVRNPLGHGPGDSPMPELSDEQTDWAIEFSMSWIRNLIRRSTRKGGD